MPTGRPARELLQLERAGIQGVAGGWQSWGLGFDIEALSARDLASMQTGSVRPSSNRHRFVALHSSARWISVAILRNNHPIQRTVQMPSHFVREANRLEKFIEGQKA